MSTVGVPVSSYLAPTGNNPTHLDVNGNGGYVVYPDITTRNAAPAWTLKVGMRCNVVSTGLDYILTALTPTWVAVGGVPYPFGAASVVTTPPVAASWDLAVNPSAHVGYGIAATISDHPLGGPLISANCSSPHEMICGLYMAIGSNKRWRCQLVCPFQWNFLSTVSLPCLSVYNSTIGKGTQFGIYAATGSDQLLVWNLDFVNAANATANPSTSYSQRLLLSPLWFEMFDDGTNFNFNWSSDGSVWNTFLSVGRTSYLSSYTHVGFGIVCMSTAQNGPMNIVAVRCGSWKASLT